VYLYKKKKKGGRKDKRDTPLGVGDQDSLATIEALSARVDNTGRTRHQKEIREAIVYTLQPGGIGNQNNYYSSARDYKTTLSSE